MKLSNLMMIFLAFILFAGAATSVANAQNQDNKKVEKEKDDDDDDADEKLSPDEAKRAKISMEEARAIALKKVSGVILEEELEKEDGKLMYSFDIRDQNGKVFDVEIDAITGEVLQAAEDDEDDDNKANRQSRQSNKKNVFVRTATTVKTATVKAVGKIF